MLIILPTWINLLLKAYALYRIFGQNGSLTNFGIHRNWFAALLFTDFSFILSQATSSSSDFADFQCLDDMDNNLINASYDLGATAGDLPPCHLPFIDEWCAMVQSVFIPSLSLFMLTRLMVGTVLLRWERLLTNFLTNATTVWVQPSVWSSSWPCSSLWVTKERRERWKICQPLSGTGLLVSTCWFLPDWHAFNAGMTWIALQA